MNPKSRTARSVPQDDSPVRYLSDRHIAGTAHIILVVEDNGSPTLTSYRRVILTINAK